MVEEIITALSRIRWLFVLDRNSTFTYKGQAVGVKQVGRELGVCAMCSKAPCAKPANGCGSRRIAHRATNFWVRLLARIAWAFA
jgi:hypothetical protein